MAWSKITSKCKKPLEWYMHKILCEFGWVIRNIDGGTAYHYHLKKCLKYGFNLYGEPLSYSVE